MLNKSYTYSAIVLGILFFALALYYWLTPAGSLPSYFPGFEVGSTHIHFKHGLASFIISLALFVYAWFKSGPVKTSNGQ